MARHSRRTFLGYSAGAAIIATGCSGASRTSTLPLQREASDENAPPSPTNTPPPPTPTATPAPFPAGTSTRALLPGTPAETPVHIRHSGVQGLATVVLGGVHGNEPGGWQAAEELAGWEPKTGSLIVVPRANVLAIADFVRTYDELGDLNRLYPGDASSPLPMERMAAAILDLAREFRASLLLDMHESWAFYAEYPGQGTAALGQTITAGVGPQQLGLGERIAGIANPQVSQREQFVVRDGTRFRRPTGTLTPAPSGSTPTATQGRSSLSAGGWVTGLTPILVEMGQMDQAIDRRVELHLIVARATLGLAGIL